MSFTAVILAFWTPIKKLICAALNLLNRGISWTPLSLRFWQIINQFVLFRIRTLDFTFRTRRCRYKKYNNYFLHGKIIWSIHLKLIFDTHIPILLCISRFNVMLNKELGYCFQFKFKPFLGNFISCIRVFAF